ncbi:uncharacterized protein LOC125945981 isoform X3 [Dermacentor silvarum]|uniref:uncharacterized protein LOC125945981 isoform X3 n=1 Tax=Dermacentor silvarum TaxID=543639 RepID=UPI002100CABB|nr:uncharacterized protein LOC125945981 isoform X3 [Dermacentor silvarum]
MKFISLSILFMYSTLCYCQYDLSTLSEDDYRKLNNTRKLLNGSTPLFLVEAVNGVIKGNSHICWSSAKASNIQPGFHHNITYYTVDKKNSPSRPKLESRSAIWYVGTVKLVPMVLLSVYDRKTSSFNITGDYLLLEAQETCLVIGIFTTNNYSSTCLHWVAQNGFSANRTLCKDVFYKNCTNLWGDWYFWREKCTPDNKPKPAHQ